MIKCRYRLVFRGRVHCGNSELPPYLRVVADAECKICKYRCKDVKQVNGGRA
jgi:hypothetical protein